MRGFRRRESAFFSGIAPSPAALKRPVACDSAAAASARAASRTPMNCTFGSWPASGTAALPRQSARTSRSPSSGASTLVSRTAAQFGCRAASRFRPQPALFGRPGGKQRDAIFGHQPRVLGAGPIGVRMAAQHQPPESAAGTASFPTAPGRNRQRTRRPASATAMAAPLQLPTDWRFTPAGPIEANSRPPSSLNPYRKVPDIGVAPGARRPGLHLFAAEQFEGQQEPVKRRQEHGGRSLHIQVLAQLAQRVCGRSETP